MRVVMAGLKLAVVEEEIKVRKLDVRSKAV